MREFKGGRTIDIDSATGEKKKKKKKKKQILTKKASAATIRTEDGSWGKDFSKEKSSRQTPQNQRATGEKVLTKIR